MILFDEVVEILDLPQFTARWNCVRCFEFLQRLGIGGIFVDRDHAWSRDVGGPQGFQEEALGCLCIACRTQEKLEGGSLGVHRSLQIHPGSFDFDVGLIDAPGISRGFQRGSTAPVQFWGIVLDPAVDGGVINTQTPLQHHFLEVAVAERITSVPAYAQQDDVCLEMTPLEGVQRIHEQGSSPSCEYPRAYTSMGLLATPNFCNR